MAVGVASGLVSAVLFDRIVRRAFGPTWWVGSLWFALGTAINLIVGRTTFSLGAAFGLAAVLALQHERTRWASAAAVAAALASPVAGLFVAVVAGAWALATPSRRVVGAIVAAAAVLPVLAIAAAFPDPGVFPYAPWAFGFDLAVCAVFALVMWREAPVLRVAAGLYALLLVAAFVVPTALGGNVSRLGQFAAGPLIACVLWRRHRAALPLLAIPLLVWQWAPAIDGIAVSGKDPSTDPAYHQPLVQQITARSALPGRLEIPFTEHHWETAYVAIDVPMARGWERQLDLQLNPQFYDDTLTASSYLAWLEENAVEWVALPDVTLDPSSVAERALLLEGLPYLREVWSNEHWVLWHVDSYQGMVTGPARLIQQDTLGFTLMVDHPGIVTVRVRASGHWHLDGDGCAEADASGWTRLHLPEAGVVHVAQQLMGSPCP